MHRGNLGVPERHPGGAAQEGGPGWGQTSEHCPLWGPRSQSRVGGSPVERRRRASQSRAGSERAQPKGPRGAARRADEGRWSVRASAEGKERSAAPRDSQVGRGWDSRGGTGAPRGTVGTAGTLTRWPPTPPAQPSPRNRFRTPRQPIRAQGSDQGRKKYILCAAKRLPFPTSRHNSAFAPAEATDRETNTVRTTAGP